MLHVFPIEPSDGWQAGDLAYCVNDRLRGATSPRVERGRVYRVTEAIKPSNIGHHGLKLEGVDTGAAWGILSNKFIKAGPAGGRLARIDAATEYTMEHYWPSLASGMSAVRSRRIAARVRRTASPVGEAETPEQFKSVHPAPAEPTTVTQNTVVGSPLSEGHAK